MSFIVSKIYDAVLAHAEWLCLAEWRRLLLETLGGSVLEIGAGTGRNLEHYGARLERLVITEPDRHMRAKLQSRICATRLRVAAEVSDDAAEQLSFADETFDAVVCTLVLCSVRDPEQSVREIFRVLRPGGQLLLVEHIAADEGSRRRRWQHRLEPLWPRLAGGCHLDRDPRQALERSGFVDMGMVIDELRGAPGFLRTVLRGRWQKPE